MRLKTEATSSMEVIYCSNDTEHQKLSDEEAADTKMQCSIRNRSLYYRSYTGVGGTAVAQWLRCCATNRKVAGSIPDGVNGIFR